MRRPLRDWPPHPEVGGALPRPRSLPAGVRTRGKLSGPVALLPRGTPPTTHAKALSRRHSRCILHKSLLCYEA